MGPQKVFFAFLLESSADLCNGVKKNIDGLRYNSGNCVFEIVTGDEKIVLKIQNRIVQSSNYISKFEKKSLYDYLTIYNQ